MATNALTIDARQKEMRALFAKPSVMAVIKQVAPKHIKPERLLRVALSAIQQTPDLLECEPVSVLKAMLQAAKYGLEPDGGPLGQGYLVPFNSKSGKQCQFIPGYRGLIKLARNSGEVVDVWAEVVYSKDHFVCEMGLDPKLEHKRGDEVSPGELTHAYAVARFRDGEKKFVVLSKREVEAIRASSKMANGGAWKDWTAEMWKKTAIRRLCKYLPLSVEIAQAIEASDEGDVVDVDFAAVLDQEAIAGPQQNE